MIISESNDDLSRAERDHHSFALYYHTNTLFISGHITFLNVMKILQNSREYLLRDELLKQNIILIDLAEVRESNSAALALMVEWIRLIKTKNKTCKIQLINAKPSLLLIAKAAGVDGMFTGL